MRTQSDHATLRDACHHPAEANTAAVVTIPADADHNWCIEDIHASYSDDAEGGLTIKVGGQKRYDIDLFGKGFGFASLKGFNQAGAKNQAVVITLAAGGDGVTGKLNVTYR